VSKTSRTPFQTYYKFVKELSENDKIIDFTLYKLKHRASQTQNSANKLNYAKIISMYKNGKIAIAWKCGAPVYIDLSKLQ